MTKVDCIVLLSNWPSPYSALESWSSWFQLVAVWVGVIALLCSSPVSSTVIRSQYPYFRTIFPICPTILNHCPGSLYLIYAILRDRGPTMAWRIIYGASLFACAVTNVQLPCTLWLQSSLNLSSSFDSGAFVAYQPWGCILYGNLARLQTMYAALIIM